MPAEFSNLKEEVARLKRGKRRWVISNGTEIAPTYGRGRLYLWEIRHLSATSERLCPDHTTI